MDKQIIFILDRSGSMSHLTNDTIGGFNSLIEQHRNEKTKVTVILFDNKYECIYKNIPIAEMPELTRETYYARGSTALLDAIGHAVVSAKDVGKTLCVIITDGEENSSNTFNYAVIKEIVKIKRENSWEFLFIGANIDAFAVGSNIGITYNANYTNNSIGTQSVYAAVSTVMSGFNNEPSYTMSNDWNKEIK